MFPSPGARIPLTVSTKCGIRSCRRLSCTSISDQAESQRTRSCTRLLYMPISTAAMTTRMTRKMMANMSLSSKVGSQKDELEINGTVPHQQRPRKRQPQSIFAFCDIHFAGERTRTTSTEEDLNEGTGKWDLGSENGTPIVAAGSTPCAPVPADPSSARKLRSSGSVRRGQTWRACER